MNIPNEKEIHHSRCRKEQAVRCVINDLLDGGMYSAIYIKLTEDKYGLDYKYSASSAQRIITDARKRMKEDYAEALPQFREQMTHMLLDIVTEAREQGDRGNAIRAIQEVCKISGVYEPEKKEVTVKEMTIDFNLLNNETEH